MLFHQTHSEIRNDAKKIVLDFSSQFGVHQVLQTGGQASFSRWRRRWSRSRGVSVPWCLDKVIVLWLEIILLGKMVRPSYRLLELKKALVVGEVVDWFSGSGAEF